MKTAIKLLILTLTTLFLNPKTNTAQCHIDDWTALKALYESTDGDNWTNNTNWQEVTGDEPTNNCNLENLYGVGLDEQGRVTCLDFDGDDNCTNNFFANGNNLNGNIPLELGNLSNLRNLFLSKNELIGSIPPELGNLSNLTNLILSTNQLSGSIPPELGNLSNLIILYLFSNQLSGSIPPELGSLSNLRTLSLPYNQLISSIPPELGNLSNLQYLLLGINQLSGNIPSQLGNLSNLIYLSMGGNRLSGSIPPELGNLSNLTTLSLSRNGLSGSIPPELVNLSSLTNLILYENQLSSSIPPELGNLSNLDLLEISDNDLSGCYSYNLAILCTQLNSSNFDGDEDISVGNNFDATWEDFCATEAGVCIPNASDVWPGDLNYDGICNNADRAISYYHIGESGAPRDSGGINWEAQACEDWGISQDNGHDIKHHDCDGNGYINTQDGNAININYGKTHPLPPGISAPTIPVYTNTDFQILLQPINQVSSANNTIIMNVVMDSKSGQNLEVFGGYFSIDYADIVANVDTAFMVFESFSWLGIPNVDLLADSWHNTTEHTIEVGFTKTNGQASTGKGIIGQAIFVLNSTNLNRRNACESLLEVAITKIGSFNAQQDTLQIEEENRIVNLENPCCAPFIKINENTPFQNRYQSSGTITTNGYLPIGQNQQVEYNGNRVRLNAGFQVKAGADFKVRNSGCN